MKYLVRNADGQLEFESFKQLEEAVRTGFVEPEDEFLREGESEWKKVSSQPSLLKHGSKGLTINRLYLWIIIAVGLGGSAFFMISRGHREDRPELYGLGLLFAFSAVGVLFKVTTDASRRQR